jgi:hypothetical protein
MVFCISADFARFYLTCSVISRDSSSWFYSSGKTLSALVPKERFRRPYSGSTEKSYLVERYVDVVLPFRTNGASFVGDMVSCFTPATHPTLLTPKDIRQMTVHRKELRGDLFIWFGGPLHKRFQGPLVCCLSDQTRARILKTFWNDSWAESVSARFPNKSLDILNIKCKCRLF